MVKCVVSGCPNRMVNYNRGAFSRPPKRFFNFPKDPTRVKVWLAALRETDKQDSVEQHVICEDHFLPEDISTNGVNSDAIPIMPPCLDGPQGMISPWGAESSEEEDQWATGSGNEDDDDDNAAAADDGGGRAAVKPPAPQTPAVKPLKQVPGPKVTSAAKTSSVSLHQAKETIPTKRVPCRQDGSLGMLARRFLELLLMAPDGSADLRQRPLPQKEAPIKHNCCLQMLPREPMNEQNFDTYVSTLTDMSPTRTSTRARRTRHCWRTSNRPFRASRSSPD